MWKDGSIQRGIGHLSLTIILFFIVAYGSVGLLFALGRLSFVEHVFGRARDHICTSYNSFDQTYATKYRYMPELQPPEFTVESMRNMTWDDKLLTPIGGFLRVEMEDGSVVGSSVSMFHHLHCLIMVRDMLTGRPMDVEFEAGGPLHWAHCLDYMANAILCHADDTLEPRGLLKDFLGINEGGLDGAPHPHQCRNSTRLFEKVLATEKEPIKISDMGKGRVFKS